jgi:hypothetical protein
MDCRRQARKRGLVIRGPQKIWDSTIASCGMLYAKRQGDAVLRRYHDAVFERFWKRELDIEDPDVVRAVLVEADADMADFPVYLAGQGRQQLEQICRAAEEMGVFGVPTFVVDGRAVLGPRALARYSRDARPSTLGQINNCRSRTKEKERVSCEPRRDEAHDQAEHAAATEDRRYQPQCNLRQNESRHAHSTFLCNCLAYRTVRF